MTVVCKSALNAGFLISCATRNLRSCCFVLRGIREVAYFYGSVKKNVAAVITIKKDYYVPYVAWPGKMNYHLISLHLYQWILLDADSVREEQ